MIPCRRVYTLSDAAVPEPGCFVIGDVRIRVRTRVRFRFRIRIRFSAWIHYTP